MKPWTIKARLIRSLMVLIGSFWLVGVIVAGFVVRHEIDEVFDSALRETTGQVIPIALHEYDIERSKNPVVADARSAELKVGRGHIHYLLRARDGTVLVRSDGAPEAALLAPLTRGFKSTSGFRYYSRFIQENGLWIQVAQDIHERQEAAFGQWIALASPLLALLPIVAFAVWRTVDRATRYIARFSSELESRGGHRLDSVETTDVPGELVPMVDAVNTLLDRLKAALETERAFAANAAHELRNPIASARAQMQVLSDRLSGNAEQARAENIASSLGQLGRRIERLLQMSRAEAGLGHSRERSDLLSIANLLVDDYVRRPDVGSRIAIDTHGAGPYWVAMDQDAIAIVLRNVIENAVIHGSRTDAITVRVGSDHAISVTNGCEPIAPENLANMKRRFTRAAKPSFAAPATGQGVQTASGAGLGLAIVDTIMRQAGGSVELLSPARDSNDGFEIVLDFPGAL